MAYDEKLAKRIEEIIKCKKGFTSKEMFGGVGYMLKGNMCIGVHKNELNKWFELALEFVKELPPKK